MKKTLGLFIGRMQPPHKGHISVIKKALQENDEVLILLGEGEGQGEKNPFTFEERKEMLESCFKDENLSVDILRDTPSDKKWVQDIGEELGNFTKIKIYGGDFENDTAIQAIKKYQELLGEKNIVYILESRDKINISATEIRDMLQKGDFEKMKLFLNKKIFEKITQF